MGPLSQACLRYFAPAQEQGRLDIYLRSTWRLLRGSSIIVIGVAFAALVVTIWHAKLIMLGLVAIILSLISGYNVTLNGVQTAARQRVVVAWHQSLLQWLCPILAIMIIPWLGPTSFAAMLGYALASLIVFGSQLLLLRRAIPLRRLAAPDAEESDALTRQMLAYAWPFVLPGVIAWLQAASDRWALQIFGGSNSVGIYAVAYQLGYYPMILISNAVTQFIAPVLFAGAGVAQNASRVQESVRLNRSIVMWWLGFSAVATAVAVGALSERHLVSTLVTGKYREGLTYVPWMVLSSGLFAAGQTSALTIMVGTKTRLLFLPMATVASAGLILNFIGAYLLGIRGVVATTVLLGAGSFVWIFLLARRYERAVRISAAC